MDLILQKQTNLSYNGSFVEVVETALSEPEIESQVKTAIVKAHPELNSREVNLEIETHDIAGMEGKKIVRIGVSFNKYADEKETLTFTLREYA